MSGMPRFNHPIYKLYRTWDGFLIPTFSKAEYDAREAKEAKTNRWLIPLFIGVVIVCGVGGFVFLIAALSR